MSLPHRFTTTRFLALLFAPLLLAPPHAAGEEAPPALSGAGLTEVPVAPALPAAAIYVCPMHPRVMSAEPGRCPVCGMDLVEKPAAPASGQEEAAHDHADHDHAGHGEAAAATYICPMHPKVLSGEPGRCPICGMDLVAKQATTPQPGLGAPAARQRSGGPREDMSIVVSDAVVNQLGVRSVPVRRGSMAREVKAYGNFLGGTVRAMRPANRPMEGGAMDHGATGAMAATVVGQVFERDAPLLRQGQTVRVRLPALGAEEWVGTVMGIENQVNASTRTLQFRVSVDVQGTVPGGMAALLAVEVDPVEDVLLVPREAVILTGRGARVVLAREGGRFEPRAVDAQDLGGDEIVIRSGLEDSDLVVVSAQFLLDSEANLQAGLRRLAGERPPRVEAPEGTAR